jgi:hypothetical protein
MTQHLLQNCSEKEILWFQRRDTLKAAAAWVLAGGAPTAMAQQRGNIVELIGDALLNGARLWPEQAIQTGDQIQTGPASSLIFVIGNASFHVRQNSRLTVGRGNSLNSVSLLRLFSGAVASVWGRGGNRAIVLPTLTAGIRGTGVYAEVFSGQDNRSYFCNCYGVVDVESGGEKLLSRSSYHQSFWGEPEPKNGRRLTPAAVINHSDQEMEFLAGLVNLRTYWQAEGQRGLRDGKGHLENEASRPHPAELPSR